MARNCSETVVQLDGQEQPVEVEQRRVLTEAVKKFSSLAKGSTTRPEHRKTFFPGLTKPSRPVMRLWPSAANISHPAQQSSFTPTILETDNSSTKDPSSYLPHPVEDSEGQQPSVSSQEETYQEGAMITGFSDEKLKNVPGNRDRDDTVERFSSESDPAYQCTVGWKPTVSAKIRRLSNWFLGRSVYASKLSKRFLQFGKQSTCTCTGVEIPQKELSII